MNDPTVTFDTTPEDGTIHLGIGQPSADLLPVELIREASASFFAEARPSDLNYGPPKGDERFLATLAEFLSRGYREKVDPRTLFVTGGSSQGLDLVCTALTKPGDKVFVEEPSYFLAFQTLKDHGLEIVGVPTDHLGMRIHALEKLIMRHRAPAFVYVVPSYHNPCGHFMVSRRRNRLRRIAHDYGFLIVADEVYHLLHYGEKNPPRPFSPWFIDEQTISLGSFSKILAPGLRLGWVQAGDWYLPTLETAGFVNSGGSINHLSSHIVRHAMKLGLLDAHVQRLKMAYRNRRDAMQEALEDHFSGVAGWRRPEGGYFFWLRFEEEVDTGALRWEAQHEGMDFQPGSLFSSRGEMNNCLRLSFAHYGEEEIREGIKRLEKAFQTLTRS